VGDGGARLARWLLAASGAALCSEQAFAGAWVQAPGHRQQITEVSRERGDFGETWHTSAYSEYGLGKNWGGHLKVDTQIREDQNFDDRTAFDAGLQRAFNLGAHGGGGVVSVGASLLAGDALEGPDCSGKGYEMRAAYGRSAKVGGHNAFVNVEAAYNERGSACRRNLVESAAGIDITPKFHVIVKAWSETGDKARSAKAETDLLYDINKKYSASLGYRREISGAFDESGFVASVWRKF
jgi:hypothetical protein